MVVSGDRDAYQLVKDGVRVMSTSRGVTDTKIYDTDAVIERYGVPPELVPDLIGLKGDTSDNIPGVPGVGEKTASQLLQKYGSVEGVLENIDEISGPKRKQNLTEHAEDARISKQLATMHFDIDIELDLEELMEREPDLSRLREVAAEFELRQVIQRLEDEWERRVPGRVTQDRIELEAEEGTLAELADGEISFALAGAAAKQRWAAYDGERLLVGDAPGAAELRDAPRVPSAARPRREVARRGGAAGAARLAGRGLVRPRPRHDARRLSDRPRPAHLRARRAGRRRGPLGGQARRGRGGRTVSSRSARRPRRSPSPSTRPRRRASSGTWPSGSARSSPTSASQQVMAEVEMPLIEVLAGMEREGIKLDASRLAAISEELSGQAESLQAEIWALAGREFTIGSPQQLGEVLFDELGLSRKRRGKTGFSTDARVLSQIRDEHEIVAKVERWREVTKLTNTYLDSLPADVDPEDGRIHTTFSQVRAATGRLSSTDPNLQNIPIRSDLGRPIRGCFVAEEGNALVSCDYNQVELRILAHVAGDEELRRIFSSGEDVHAATAAGIIGADPEAITPGERSKAKMVNYGIAYGLSAYGLAERLSIPQDEAAAYIERYFERFEGVKRFIDETIERAIEEGRVTTLMGRRRLIPELRVAQLPDPDPGRAPRRQHGDPGHGRRHHQAGDDPQPPGARLRAARVEADPADPRRAALRGARTAETEQVCELARREMVDAFELDPPLAVDIGSGPDWLSAK